MARRGVAVQPVMVCGEVELATRRRECAARCLIAISHSFSRRCMADLARLGDAAARRDLIDLLPAGASSASSIDLRVAAQRPEELLLPFELLQQVGLEVGAARRRR